MRWMPLFFQERCGEAGVVPGGERGVLDPARGNAVFALQDVLHDASLGEGAAAGFAAADQYREAAGAVQIGGVAQPFQADAVESVAAVFSRIQVFSTAEDDDGVRPLQCGRADGRTDFQAFLQQAADPWGGQGVECSGGKQDQRLGEAGTAALNNQPGGQQNHQQQRRQQGGGDKIGGKPDGHGENCMSARYQISHTVFDFAPGGQLKFPAFRDCPLLQRLGHENLFR